MSICSTLITCYSCTEMTVLVMYCKSIHIVVLNSSLTEIFTVTDVSGLICSVEFDYGLWEAEKQ